jgi:hypothetical protein
MLGGLAVDGSALAVAVVFPGVNVLVNFVAVFFEAKAMVSLSGIFILGQLPLRDFIPSARPLKFDNLIYRQSRLPGASFTMLT